MTKLDEHSMLMSVGCGHSSCHSAKRIDSAEKDTARGTGAINRLNVVLHEQVSVNAGVVDISTDDAASGNHRGFLECHRRARKNNRRKRTLFEKVTLEIHTIAARNSDDVTINTNSGGDRVLRIGLV